VTLGSRRLLGAAVVATLALGGCDAAASVEPTPKVGTRTGDVAPALSGTSLERRMVSLRALHGSVVVVVFWASWCAPCQAEQPAVNALARQEAHSGVHFLGVSVDIDAAAAGEYASRFAVPYDSLVDTAQTIAVDYDIAGPPTTYVINRSGRVAAELVGELNTEHLRAVITAAQGNA
jgi:peroxiredoxin